MNVRNGLAILAVTVALAVGAAMAADPVPSVVNPIGKWDDYEMIMQVDVPLRGTLRQVYVDRPSAAETRRTGELPYGTKIVMRDYAGVPDGKGGWKTENNRLVAGQPAAVLVQEKEKGWGVTHPADVRMGEWEFGFYTAEGKPIPVDLEKTCMGCHHPLAATEYTFVVHNFFKEAAAKNSAK
jgi:hypothetical protein